MKSRKVAKLISHLLVVSVVGATISSSFSMFTGQVQAMQNVQAVSMETTNQYTTQKAMENLFRNPSFYFEVGNSTMEGWKLLRNTTAVLTANVPIALKNELDENGDVLTESKHIKLKTDLPSGEIGGYVRADTVVIIGQTIDTIAGHEYQIEGTHTGLDKMGYTVFDGIDVYAGHKALTTSYVMNPDEQKRQVVFIAKSNKTSIGNRAYSNKSDNWQAFHMKHLKVVDLTVIKEEEAKKIVSQLFINDDPTMNVLKDTTNQEAIAVAQKAIDRVEDTLKKAKLQADLDRVQELLSQKVIETQAEKDKQDVATKAVQDLFINGNPLTNQIKDTTNQQAIDNAQKLVNEIQDETVKKDLQMYLDVAKVHLKKQDEVQVVIAPHDYVLGVSRYITGTYEGDVAFVRVTIDGKEYKGGVTSNGTFNFYSFDKIQSLTSEVIVSAYDASGELLDTKIVTLKSNVEVTKGYIAPDDFIIGNKNITGTYAHDVKSLIVTVNGTSYKGGTFHGDGEFKFYVFGKIKSANDIVTIQALDKKNNILDTKIVTVKSAFIEDIGEINLDTFTIGDKNITGSYTGSVKSIVIKVNGISYKGGTFHNNGTFKFYAVDKIKKATDVVSVEGFDKFGKLLDIKNLTMNTKKLTK
ncbi:hypothetical protein BMT55_01625 [Listeria newyorkensis]|uniref:Uncharacterized protein n=1 Tax=Listeria newyorkensis TaxID=1497681 RepID=A0ABX4XRY4_9LIST|nr:immunoglobulin-like domain-containing protein [Listeria newyorkensis]KGL43790.1 hypothetical protein EP58_04835 [Listeria newyorkensis]PNP95073.1 hypothetical protein BMT55_01625 [Listeria newyorkensis]WAO22006.1 toxin Cry1Ac domain D-VI-related protein [Listeria newyorkensis]SQC59042.1 Uncharacterised protein [Listeria newyorkensis]